MGGSIKNNLSAMNAQRMTGIVSVQKSKSTEKLSSGYRINRAADDAAGLSISEKMRRQIRGLNQATINCQSGVSFMQIVDGAMNEVSDMLNRMETLAVQASNATLTDEDRSYLDAEFQKLKEEIDDINDKTTFNEIPVFGTRIRQTVYSGSVDPANIVSTTSGMHISGNSVGLGAVLNCDGGHHYSESRKMTSPVKFSGGTWTSSGSLDNEQANHALNIAAYIYTSYGATATSRYTIQNDALAALQSGTPSTKTYYNNDQSVKVDVSYVASGAKTLDGKDVLDAQITQYTKDANGNYVENSKNTRWASTGWGGMSGLNDGKNYPCSWIDFSGFNTSYKPESLYGLGFNSSCCSCSKYYTVKFSDGSDMGGAASRISGISNNPVLEINVSSCSTGADLVNAIMNAVNTSGNSFSNHYQQYAVNSSEPAKLYIYDNRPSCYPSGGCSTFELQTRTIEGQLEGSDVNVEKMNGDIVAFEKEDLYIQSSVEAGQGFFLRRAIVDSSYIGISGADLCSVDGAQESIESVKNANHILSSERSMIGAQQNRLEKAINVDMNSSENTTASESRIRDTDMAQEMTEYSKHNILEQAGISILSQANNSNQTVLQLLG